MKILKLILIVALAGCGMQMEKKVPVKETTAAIPPTPSPSVPGDVSTNTFAAVREKLITPFCIRCHQAGGSASDLPFSTYESLMGAGVVTAGNPATSAFYTQVADGKMPPRGAKPGPELVTLISAWITEGAKNN